jgi:glycosyltransferase involved in cell wall biosynthesis
VAVCIVTHNSAADLPGCLEAVGRLEHRPLEIVVVDCASSDGSLETARSTAPPGPRSSLSASPRTPGSRAA